MYIHEYQAKAWLAGHGVQTPAHRLAASPEQAASGFGDLNIQRGVVKAQIHAGGRGKAGGIIAVASAREAEDAARKLLGTTLVTRQTGPRGRPVDKVIVEEALDVAREIYLGFVLDRDAGRPMAVASAQGGVEIETLAHTEGALQREWGSPEAGVAPFQARKLCAHLGLTAEQQRMLVPMVLTLGKMFVQYDCSLIEINPLVLCRDGRLLPADVKVSFDDNALVRHSAIADLRDAAQEDPREVEARRHDLSYVGLDGTIGCMVNGAGLAMATMDVLLLHGGRPANFLDVGGDATVEKVVAAFQLLLRDRNVRTILVNIFGGIVRCDLIAEGILQAVRQVDLTVPLVVRLNGNKAEEGRAALARSGLSIASATELSEAAMKAVELAVKARRAGKAGG